MKYHYIKSNKKLGKTYLILSIVIFIFVYLINYQFGNSEYRALNYFFMLFYTTPILFFYYGIYCLVQGGTWDIVIDEEIISINPPTGVSTKYRSKEVSMIEVVDPINSIPSCYIILKVGKKIELNLNSGISLNKFLNAAKKNGIEINRYSVT